MPFCQCLVSAGSLSGGRRAEPAEAITDNGTIRAGRDRETRGRLLTELSQAWLSITGQDARSLLIGLNDIDPTSIKEAGLIMPASGEEAEWRERNQEVLGELLASQQAPRTDSEQQANKSPTCAVVLWWAL